jgi:DNA polymerase I-like protein with 3'-5' exonuclease and polymerase domains
VNLGFEYMTFYWNFGMRTFNFFDCSVVEKCIWAGAHSLKDYGFFGMEEMMDRYFKVLIDKELQTSFNLNDPLSHEQVCYAALDTRFPMGLKAVQTLVLQGQTVKGLQAKGNLAWKTLSNIDPVVTGDNLLEIAQIENDAIGAFQDMHIHGERVDRNKWLTRVAGKKEELKSLISGVLDPIFLPLVGSKNETITDEVIAEAEQKWKAFNALSDAEIQLKGHIRTAKKKHPEDVPSLEAIMVDLVESRKAEKEIWKKACGDLKKKRTKIKNLAAKCEGEALINYSSDAQLLDVIETMKGLKSVKSLADETLEKYKHIAVMAAVQKYHGLSKEIGTYGDQWALEWMTKPCKEEGWLHPGDGRLHCVFNQYEAETGRSSSERPNAQNLPQDKEIRSSFVADPPNESIRVSNCCELDTWLELPYEHGGSIQYRCKGCNLTCDTHAEEYVLITADMSGAELRIIAELANDPVWIGAFTRGEDVHSVCTELLYGADWEKLTEPGCVYYELNDKGEPKHHKCKCKGHNELRNDTKAVNFLLAYGGGPFPLAARIGKSVDDAKKLMAIHEQRFPRIWSYLEKSGRNAKIRKKSFDMYGRRRLFPEPTQERATLKAMEDFEEKLRLDEAQAEANIAAYIAAQGAKPSKDEEWTLTHRMPTQKEITKSIMSLAGSIERQGKNHSSQGTNATIAKLAMSCGFDADGNPFLWHVLPLYRAKLIKFVHDELVIQAPKHLAEKVAAEVQSAFERAAKIKMKQVVMESEYSVAQFWKK